MIHMNWDLAREGPSDPVANRKFAWLVAQVLGALLLVGALAWWASG